MSRHFCRTALLVLLSFEGAYGRVPTVHVVGQRVTYHGFVSNHSIEHFQGIKFAEDTSGERRFAPPQPYAPERDSDVNATRAGPLCPQYEAALPLLFDATPKMSEDCLNLRIARPAGIGVSPYSKLPVVVWLHGGGLVVGSAYDSHFDPDKLLQLAVADGKPIIYASINYRMSIFGFPRLPLLKDQKSLNLGLRDQRLGLQWIEDNIVAFGGDPERITVYGLSAGGTFAGLHTLAYGGQHGVPFQQAWMMSGPPGTALNLTSDGTVGHTMSVAQRLDCASDRNDLEVLRCLRAVPMKDLLDATMAYAGENHPPLGIFTFLPSVDDDMFPDSQSHLLRDGRFVKGIKLILGWTHDDGTAQVGDAQAIQNEEDMANAIRGFASALSAAELSKLYGLYPAEAFQHRLENYEFHKKTTDPTITVHFLRVSQILRDILFTCPSIEYGYEMVRHTRLLQPEFDSVRLYDLNQSAFTTMMAEAGMGYLGVLHGSDTPYVFNGFPEGDFSPSDQELATTMSRSLINFAHSGAPVTEGSFRWPPAYPPVDDLGAPESVPPSFNIAVLGGPHGTGPAAVESGWYDSKLGMQAVLNGILDFAGMGPPSNAIREQLIRNEDLHARCGYINSLHEPLGS